MFESLIHIQLNQLWIVCVRKERKKSKLIFSFATIDIPYISKCCISHKSVHIVGVLKRNFRKVVQVCRPWNSPENTPEKSMNLCKCPNCSHLVISLPARTEFGHSIIDAHGWNIYNLNHLPWRQKIMSAI